MKKKLVICFMAFALVMSTMNFSRAEELKSPILAGVLSWLVPGVGQYYNGRPEDITKGLIIDGVFVLGIVLVVIGVSNTVSAGFTYDAYGDVTGVKPASIDTGAILGGTALWVGAAIFGIVDAILSADDINKHGMKKADANFGVNTAMLQDSHFGLVPGAQLSLNF